MRFRSAKDLTPSDTGRRVTVRRRLAGGQASDVIGVLVEAGPSAITIERADGSSIAIARDEIIAARVIGA